MPLTHPNKYTTLSPNINTESFDHWSLPALETLAGCNYSKTGQTLLQIRPVAVCLLSILLWWAFVNTTPSLQYWLHLLSFRNIPLSPQLLLIRQNTHSLLPLSSRMLLKWQEELEGGKQNNGQWRLFVVFCRVQLARLSWAFSRQKRRRERSRNELSSGCTPRLLTLTGTQMGKVLSVGHKVA